MAASNVRVQYANVGDLEFPISNFGFEDSEFCDWTPRLTSHKS